MASNNQLPKGTYTDSNGQKLTINTLQPWQVNLNNVDVNTKSTVWLIDRVSNNLLSGSGMKLFSTPVNPEYVDIIGAPDRVDTWMYNLMFATYCDVETSTQGGHCLGVLTHCIIYGKWKSIILPNQCASFGNNFQEWPRRYVVAQKITTRDGYVFKLKYQRITTYMPLEEPRYNYITDLNHVYFGRPVDWNIDN